MAMSAKDKKIAQIITAYVGVTIILALLGFLIGNSYSKNGKHRGMEFAIAGGILGVVISIILYFTVGKKEIAKASTQ